MKSSTTLLLLTLALLGACSSPPKPTEVDDTRRQPANTAMAVELQMCKNELANTRVLLTETTRLAERSSARATQATLEQQLRARESAREVVVTNTSKGNRIYTVLFPTGSSEIDITTQAFDELRADALGGAWVVIRGRTDGTRESPAESRVAQERASKMQAMLVVAGIDPTKIQVSYQPVGDHVASQVTQQGRSQNRRVEVEVYSVKPIRTVLSKATS